VVLQQRAGAGYPPHRCHAGRAGYRGACVPATGRCCVGFLAAGARPWRPADAARVFIPPWC